MFFLIKKKIFFLVGLTVLMELNLSVLIIIVVFSGF